MDIRNTRPESAQATYDQMAAHYDAFTAHHDYQVWLGALLKAARAHGLVGRRLLDVGCGTGKSFLPLIDQDWQICGCDISAEMIAIAREKAPSTVQLEVADMRALPSFGEFDLVWCLDDAINYLLDPDDLVSALCAMRSNLAARGLLVFDVNTLLTYRTFFAETQIISSGSHVLRWEGRASPTAGPGDTFEALFEALVAGQSSSQTIHTQRHFPPEQILSAFEQAVLEPLAIFGHGLDARFEQPLDESRHTKAVFLARRPATEEGG